MLLPFALIASSLLADDLPVWGGFRGNNGRGALSEGALPQTLDADDGLVWRTEIPTGYSSPTIAGDAVFVSAVEGEELLTLCLSLEDGSLRWRRALDFDGSKVGANSAAAPTPVTDGEAVYVLFHHFGLVSYDLEGNEQWAVELGPFNIPHGLSSSPVLHEDRLILQLDQDGGSVLAAYDKYDGEELWSVDRKDFTHSYATPAIHAPEDGPAQVIVSGSFKISSYAVEDGRPLWWVDGSCFMSKGIPVVVGEHCYVASYAGSIAEAGLPRISQDFAEALAQKDADGDGKISPTEFDHPGMNQAWFVFDLDDDGFFGEEDWDYLRACSRPTGGLFRIRLDGEGDVTRTHVDWKYDGRRGLPDCTSPVVTDEGVFVVKRGGLLTCFDPQTGEVGKQERVGDPDQYYASPVTAGGRLLTASLSGQLCLVSAVADWETISTIHLNEPIWSTPALVDGRIVVRTQTALYCLEDPGSRP